MPPRCAWTRPVAGGWSRLPGGAADLSTQASAQGRVCAVRARDRRPESLRDQLDRSIPGRHPVCSSAQTLMRRPPFQLWFVGCAVLAGCAQGGPDGVALENEAIVGGVSDSADPAVVLVSMPTSWPGSSNPQE